MKNLLVLFLLSLFCCTPSIHNQMERLSKQPFRYASYNVALFRKAKGDLAKDLASGADQQIQNIAAVIQHINPDVIALLEFDYDPTGKLLDAFQQNYLAKAQQGQHPIDFPYRLQFPSNTGVLATTDFDNNGKIELPNDAYGFGRYEGQYAFAILSKFPLEEKAIRSFQKFRWKDLPNAKAPINEDGSSYYSEATWEEFRLSSKNHVDVPVKIGNKTLHTIIAHPTPPVFDGPEDKNGKRNFDEIRLLKDYVEGAAYLKNDQGEEGGLIDGSAFVIMGDLNADPIDGDSYEGAINQLLDSPKINQAISNGAKIPSSKGGKVHNKRATDKGDPAFDTAFFGARIDYVLPSSDIKVLRTGVFWPVEGEPLYEVVRDRNASDHLLVWADLQL